MIKSMHVSLPPPLCILVSSTYLIRMTTSSEKYFVDLMFFYITQQYVSCKLFFNILLIGIKYTISTVSLKVFVRNITVLNT